MITIEEAKQLAKEILSEKRYTHTLNVCEMATMLAQKFGEDTQKTQLAALLHDLMKEKTKEELLLIAHKNGIILDNIFQKPQALWHGPISALYCEKVLKIDNQEILSAICCHSTGKENMSRLDKIIYLADMVSAERDYDGLEQLRELAFNDLDLGMIKALEMNIEFIKEKGREVDKESIETLNWLKANI